MCHVQGHPQDNTGLTPSRQAHQRSRLQVVKGLLEAGADVNAKGKYNDTALIRAAEAGHLEILRILLEKGADDNARGEKIQTALMSAAAAGHLEVVKSLLDAGARVNTLDDSKTLTSPAFRPHPEVVQGLLDWGIDFEIQGHRRNTALKLASANGHFEVVKLLKAHGARE